MKKNEILKKKKFLQKNFKKNLRKKYGFIKEINFKSLSG